MGRKERRYMKRNIRSVYQRMDKNMSDLREIAAIFEPVHPEEAAVLEVIAQIELQAQTALSQWYGVVWGSAPDDWYTAV